MTSAKTMSQRKLYMYVLLSGGFVAGVGVYNVTLVNHACVLLQADQQQVLEADTAAPDLQEPPVTTTAPVPFELPEQTITPDVSLGLASDRDGPGASPKASVTADLGNDNDVCQDHQPEEIVRVSIVISGFSRKGGCT
jgi:hypothetical protein